MEIKIAGVGFRYDAEPVLDSVDFTVSSGEMLGIVGPNGSGKSTLLQVMSKTLPPTAGAVLIAGESIGQIPRRRLARMMAVIRQHETVAFDFTVRDTVLMGRHPYLQRFSGESPADIAAAEAAMDLAGIKHLADRSLSRMSGGERQRVALARALAQDTQILLLDEPTSSLDIKYQVEVLSILRKLAAGGRTIAIVLHELNLASQYCDRLLLLSAGRIVRAGRPAEVLQEPVLQQVYGVHALVRAHPHTGRPVVLPAVPSA